MTTKPVRSTMYGWLRGVSAAAIVTLVLAGCTTPTVLEGTAVTVATSAAMFSLNDQTSYGDSSANSGVLQATSSSFNRYDDSSMLVGDASFGSYQLLSNDPLTVMYTIARDVTWSDGVPVDAADLMLAWLANSGTHNTQDFDDSGYRDEETGQYARSFPHDVVYFDGATSEGLQYVTATPSVSNDGRSLTLIWDSYFVDWPLLLQVGLPAHVVASKALKMPLAAVAAVDGEAEDGIDRVGDALRAKDALIAAIRDDDTAALSSLADVWNSGFDLDAMPDDDSLLVSTGPYTITGFVPGESVTLTANNRYSGEHSPVFETVVVRFLADPLDQVAALADGSLDVVVPRPSSEVISALEDVRGTTLLQVPDGAYGHLDLMAAGSKHATFLDERVREAFLKTIPTQQIRDAALGSPLAGTSERLSLVFMPGEPGYLDAIAENGSARFAHPDVKGAIELLAEADVTAPRVCMMFDPANPKRVQEFQFIADAAELAGFVVTNCSGPDWLILLGTPGAFDASIFTWTSSNLSVAGLQSIFGTGGRGNLNGYSNSEVDGLLDELAVTPDLDAQQGIRTKIDAALYAGAYGLPLYQDQIVVAHNPTLTGVKPATLASGVLWNIWEWAPVVEDEEGLPSMMRTETSPLAKS